MDGRQRRHDRHVSFRELRDENERKWLPTCRGVLVGMSGRLGVLDMVVVGMGASWVDPADLPCACGEGHM